MARIGILGVAHLHVDAYIVNLRAAGAEVVGVHDWDAERGAAWGAQHSVAFFGDVDRLLREDLDGVVVCAETLHHRALVERAAAAAVAVLCEKPLGVSAEDNDAIVDACEQAGVSLMTAFPVRFHPAVRQLHSMTSTGELGAIRAFSGTNQSVMPLRERSWFADPRLAGGGAMMDHIVHLADIVNWIMGEAPTEVYAVGNRIVHAEIVTVETSGLVLVSYPSGVFASIDCSWNRPLSYPTWGGIALSVIADGGTVDVDPTRQQLTQFGGDRTFGWVPWGLDTNQLMIDEFLDAIREQRQPSVTGRDGLLATRVALAALESAASGDPVFLSV
ncbi:Gfo/Idh/MocA family protein [Pseudonocardia acidicola]|uniref:Gfo/Idh/MocA family oxidoreductase n=1 Tax=Pseudonocardia acidicola TaxID=2724939 RepID=A0ABX1S749_9PSEU|nr:Gfo/Idh/MocA family oxidoreductase [Pseudonocardia acidicola]NMH97390.1 Gfo/Idh/MocA family oxidoreductase [Pseudonocardia acidicola]